MSKTDYVRERVEACKLIVKEYNADCFTPLEAAYDAGHARAQAEMNEAQHYIEHQDKKIDRLTTLLRKCLKELEGLSPFTTTLKEKLRKELGDK